MGSIIPAFRGKPFLLFSRPRFISRSQQQLKKHCAGGTFFIYYVLGFIYPIGRVFSYPNVPVAVRRDKRIEQKTQNFFML